MSAPHSDAFVFFGASGDLAYKQIFPALYSMIKHGHLDVPIIGVAKSGWTLDQLKERANDSLAKQGEIEQETLEKLLSLLQYIDGDYQTAETFEKLRNVLGKAERPLFYLAIPPNLFAAVISGLAKANCAKNARVVVEKPFGRDIKSAQELNETLHQTFTEDEIFRIDHFLGKEPVQNMVYFRFANPTVHAAWNRHHIDCVQITMAEQFDIADRGALYDELGAIRDVVQNHLLQLIACLAMECPSSKSHKALCDERTKLIECIKPLEAKDVVRGQFNGYQETKGVKKDSNVETFAALKFQIENERWKGVPFFVRTGKCLPVTITEALVSFKRPKHPVLDESTRGTDGYYRFRLGPKEAIALGTKIKQPGEEMIGHTAEMVVNENAQNEMPPYERLLGDAMKGDATLFSREDSVEAAWQILDPILDHLTPAFKYEKNTWGPAEVDAQLKPSIGWHDPIPDA